MQNKILSIREQPEKEIVTDFLFLSSQITADSDYSHEIRRWLLLGRKTMTNLDSVLKSRDITLPTKVHIVKAMVFPVVMYSCESWTVKQAEHQRIDAFKLWCWRRLLKVPWPGRRSNKQILRELNPEYSLEGPMLMLGRGEEGIREWDGWMVSPMQWTWTWTNSGGWWETGRLGMLQSMESQKVGHG